MSIHGYPDWQGSPLWRGPPIVNEVGVNPPVGGFVPPLGTTLTNFAYLLLAGSLTGNNCTVQISFSDSQSLANNITYEIILNQNPFSYVIPIVFDQVAIAAVRASATAASLNLYVAPVNSPYFLSPVDSTLIVSGSVGPLAQNATGELAIVNYSGFAQLEIESTQNNFNTRVKCYDQDGVTLIGRSFFNSTAVNAFTSQVWLPPTNNTIAVTNLNAAAATFTVYLWAQSAIPK